MNKLLNVRKAADLLGIHPVTLRNWARAGKINFIRVGRNIAFDQDYLDLWIKQQTNIVRPWSPARRAVYEQSKVA